MSKLIIKQIKDCKVKINDEWYSVKPFKLKSNIDLNKIQAGQGNIKHDN